jgi:hypothetical protein
MIHFHVLKSQPLNTDLSQLTSVQTHILKLFTAILTLLSQQCLDLPAGLRLSDQNFARILLSPIRATCRCVWQCGNKRFITANAHMCVQVFLTCFLLGNIKTTKLRPCGI